MNRVFALAAFLLALIPGLARAQTPITLYNADGSVSQLTYSGPLNYDVFGLSIYGVAKAAPIVTGGIGYATPADTVGPGFNAWQINRPVENSNWMAVGAQINAWCYAGTMPCFAGATETVNWSPTASFNQIAWEAGVVNMNPNNTGYLVGLNPVIKCQMDNTYQNGAHPCPPQFVDNSIMLLGTSQIGTYWKRGIVFGWHSIALDGATIDWSSLGDEPDRIILKLPNGRPVTAAQLEALFP